MFPISQISTLKTWILLFVSCSPYFLLETSVWFCVIELCDMIAIRGHLTEREETVCYRNLFFKKKERKRTIFNIEVIRTCHFMLLFASWHRWQDKGAYMERRWKFRPDVRKHFPCWTCMVANQVRQKHFPI